jgi:hypothetical protein
VIAFKRPDSRISGVAHPLQSTVNVRGIHPLINFNDKDKDKEHEKNSSNSTHGSDGSDDDPLHFNPGFSTDRNQYAPVGQQDSAAEESTTAMRCFK